MFGLWSVSTVHSEVSEREPCLVHGQRLQCTVRSQRGSHVWSMHDNIVNVILRCQSLVTDGRCQQRVDV